MGLDMTALELVVYLLASARLTFMLLYDDFPFAPIRDWWLSRWPSDETEFVGDKVARTGGVWHVEGRPNVPLLHVAGDEDPVFYALRPSKLGTLFECAWCMSMWAGGAVLAAVWLLPAIAWPLAYVGAGSMVAGYLNDLRR